MCVWGVIFALLFILLTISVYMLIHITGIHAGSVRFAVLSVLGCVGCVSCNTIQGLPLLCVCAFALLNECWQSFHLGLHTHTAELPMLMDTARKKPRTYSPHVIPCVLGTNLGFCPYISAWVLNLWALWSIVRLLLEQPIQSPRRHSGGDPAYLVHPKLVKTWTDQLL